MLSAKIQPCLKLSVEFSVIWAHKFYCLFQPFYLLFFFPRSLASEGVLWLMLLVSQRFWLLFGVEQGRSQPCRRPQRSPASHFVKMKALCQALGAQQKSDPRSIPDSSLSAFSGITYSAPPRRAFQAISSFQGDASLAPPWTSLCSSLSAEAGIPEPSLVVRVSRTLGTSRKHSFHTMVNRLT